jgi:hypothetical protein
MCFKAPQIVLQIKFRSVLSQNVDNCFSKCEQKKLLMIFHLPFPSKIIRMVWIIILKSSANEMFSI